MLGSETTAAPPSGTFVSGSHPRLIHQEAPATLFAHSDRVVCRFVPGALRRSACARLPGSDGPPLLAALREKQGGAGSRCYLSSQTVQDRRSVSLELLGALSTGVIASLRLFAIAGGLRAAGAWAPAARRRRVRGRYLRAGAVLDKSVDNWRASLRQRAALRDAAAESVRLSRVRVLTL